MNNHFKPYKANKDRPWNLSRVWMLHRRAGFGANWSDLQRDLSDSPENAVDRILKGKSRNTNVDFESTSKLLLKKAIESGQVSRLQAWWVLRMYLGPNAFRERRTLMWHNHFATSNQTIQNTTRMYRQNAIFRKNGDGPFANLLEKAVKDPAMLVWLNANDNRSDHPNENLGRELLELFSLGLGNYTEKDVKESARALAGWTVNQTLPMTSDPFSDEFEDKMSIRRLWRDEFEKTILGQTGSWDGDDLLKIVSQHKATSKRLAWRICDEFFGENVVSQAALDELAAGLHKNKLNLSWAYRTVLTSELFFSNANLKTKIAPPETFLLGTLIGLDTKSNPASTLAIAKIMTSLGRSLFEPPNVGGWDGGRLWLNARTVVARSNFIDAFLRNGINRQSEPPDFDQIAESFGGGSNFETEVGNFAELLLGLDLETKRAQTIVAATITAANKVNNVNRRSLACKLLLNTSDAQLC